ncbi:hypothetical protein I7I53_03882 [Histoplasma capsulatum var. duboisii H88]|uniref:Uncharacterized protein n=1 Tax=Ajellomyces capsulatus (strain H88) TaxID=544711 RepID=A0A8A1LQ12_AJEC8|nr:hypothetical protein I7I53_03882 [Histoplasma capsulatum var. duboisii H88]
MKPFFFIYSPLLNCSVLEQDLPLVALAAGILTFPGSLTFPSSQSPLHEFTSSQHVSLYICIYKLMYTTPAK